MKNWLKLLHLKNTAVPIRVTLNVSELEEEFRGFILAVNSSFLVLLNIDDWHTDGISIFPISRIGSCIQDSDFGEKQKIWNWLKVDLSPDYAWLALEDYGTLFSSIKAHGKVIYICDDSSAEVGVVEAVADDRISLRGIDGEGCWLEAPFEFKFEEVFQVIVDDEYSTVLWKYASARGQDKQNMASEK